VSTLTHIPSLVGGSLCMRFCLYHTHTHTLSLSLSVSYTNTHTLSIYLSACPSRGRDHAAAVEALAALEQGGTAPPSLDVLLQAATAYASLQQTDALRSVLDRALWLPAPARTADAALVAVARTLRAAGASREARLVRHACPPLAAHARAFQRLQLHKCICSFYVHS
jgi:hypothetical protein